MFAPDGVVVVQWGGWLFSLDGVIAATPVADEGYTFAIPLARGPVGRLAEMLEGDVDA